MPTPLGVSPDKAGSRVINQPAAPPLSPLSFLPFQPPCPWPRSQRPCVKRLVTCGKGNCLLCAGSPASGLLFTCYSVLPPLRYPRKTRPGERSASTAELVWARSWEAGKEGLQGFSMPKSPNSTGWSVQEPSTYREVRKNPGNEKIQCNAKVPGNAAGSRAEIRPCPRAV